MSDNTQYLRFSAYSMKELITRKLSEDTKFTDQIYEGSNLAILIDLVSYMYQCLIYQLNTAASEAMFSDTQIYENINRLCKFIGYNPKGYSPSVITFVTNTQIEQSVDIELSIKKYSAIDTGKYDANGKKIYYSTISDYDNNSLSRIDNERTILCYNGLWKLYSTIFSSSGDEYQTFILTGIKSNAAEQKYVSEQMIHVYIQYNGIFKQWNSTSDGLFMDNDSDNGTYIHNNSELIYNVRLNENKQYEITFGNGSLGKIPPKDSLIYIMYLDSNDETTYINPFEISQKKLIHNKSLFGMTQDIYNGIFEISNGDNYDVDQHNNMYTDAVWTNTAKSSTGKIEESVEDIRRNAPNWFKTGNRLVTATDYEYYIKNRFKTDIIDIFCQNNSQYISTFYRWLYNIGIKRFGRGDYYITPNRIIKYDLHYADAADANNVYLWIKMKDDAEIYKELINTEITGVKTLTHEPVYLSPIIVYFYPCAQEVEQARIMNFSEDNKLFDENNYSFIEITIENNTLYANSNIQQRVAKIIQEFFNEDNFKIGQLINNSVLLDKIYEIGAISNIRTVYYNTETGEKRITPGLSFATWSATYIDAGDDLDISNTSVSLEPFQFPKLYNSANIVNKIKVIRKAINDVNTIQY